MIDHRQDQADDGADEELEAVDRGAPDEGERGHREVQPATEVGLDRVEDLVGRGEQQRGTGADVLGDGGRRRVPPLGHRGGSLVQRAQARA